jgi:NAD(P)-dependent dehydrogenase (short-subunit alcohol dehydrogenase family)
LQKRNATVAVIGAGDYIGGEIAKKFASEGFTVFAGRRNGAKLEPLVKEIEQAGGEIHARSLDARKEEEIISFLGDADKHAPLEVCIYIGANVNFPILDTTERVFRKVWEMACYSGFLAGREAARLMLPRGKGNIFFTEQMLLWHTLPAASAGKILKHKLRSLRSNERPRGHQMRQPWADDVLAGNGTKPRQEQKISE